MKAILRSTESKQVNIPSKIWKEAGWNINDEVKLIVCECYNEKNEKWFSISIDRTKDDKYWEDD